MLPLPHWYSQRAVELTATGPAIMGLDPLFDHRETTVAYQLPVLMDSVRNLRLKGKLYNG